MWRVKDTYGSHPFCGTLSWKSSQASPFLDILCSALKLIGITWATTLIIKLSINRDHPDILKQPTPFSATESSASSLTSFKYKLVPKVTSLRSISIIAKRSFFNQQTLKTAPSIRCCGNGRSFHIASSSFRYIEAFHFNQVHIILVSMWSYSFLGSNIKFSYLCVESFLNKW